MYLHIGNKKTIKAEEIVGIFDLDNTTVSRRSRDFLKRAEKDKRLIYDSYELPKSFVVCEKENKKNVVYLSQLSSATLEKRIRKNTSLTEE